MAYQGQIVEIPIGTTGLAGSRSQSQIPPTALIEALNLSFALGSIQKEGGTTKYNSSAISGTPAIQGGWDWNHNGSAQRMVVVCDDGKIYKDSGGGTFGTTLASGLTISSATVPVFVEGGKEAAANDRALFIFTGTNQVQVLNADGATTSDISTPPSDWSSSYPTFGLNHEGRLWGGGNANDPHRLYYSTTSDHEDVSGGGTLAVYPGEGEKLVGALSFKGFIIAFKHPRGIYAIDTTSPTVGNWKVKRISGDLGCAGTGCLTVVQDDIVFVDQAGNIRLLSSVDEFGDVTTRGLSDLQNVNAWIDDNLDFSQNGVWRSVYYPTKREYHLACTGSGATTNNTRLVIDFNGQVPRFRHSDRDTAVSMWIRDNSDVPEMVYGDNGGFVRQMDQSARSHDSSGYAGTFQTPHMDFSHIDPVLATKVKNFHFLELVVEPQGNWNLSVDVIVDGTTVQTVQFNMGTDAAALGSFVLNTHKLGEDSVVNRRKRIVGSGRRISLKGTNSGDAEDFSVAKMMVHFGVGDERESV